MKIVKHFSQKDCRGNLKTISLQEAKEMGKKSGKILYNLIHNIKG